MLFWMDSPQGAHGLVEALSSFVVGIASWPQQWGCTRRIELRHAAAAAEAAVGSQASCKGHKCTLVVWEPSLQIHDAGCRRVADDPDLGGAGYAQEGDAHLAEAVGETHGRVPVICDFSERLVSASTEYSEYKVFEHHGRSSIQ